jgi:hypothetical protein
MTRNQLSVIAIMVVMCLILLYITDARAIEHINKLEARQDSLMQQIEELRLDIIYTDAKIKLWEALMR